MGYLHEDEVREYLSLFGYVISSFNKYWLLAPLALPVIGAFMLFRKRHKQGSYWVPSWCARWIRYARFNPYEQYANSSPSDDRSLWMSHNMMRRRCAPGYAYEVRRLLDSDNRMVYFHRFPEWPEDMHKKHGGQSRRDSENFSGEILWSGTIPSHRTPWKDIEWTRMIA